MRESKLFNWIKRFWGSGATAYQPVSGRIMPHGNPFYGTTAGVTIDESTALTLPAFFHAMRTYGAILGSQDFNLIELLDRGQQIARSHPIHRLLHDEPNEFQGPTSFWETLIGAHAFPYGNGYAYIERDGNFRATALLPLLPDRTFPRRIGGRLTYRTHVNGQPIDLEPYDVFHVAGFGGDGLTGYPLVQIMKSTLGLSKAEEEFAAAFFGNGCNVGGVVDVPGTLSKEAMANMKSSLAEKYGGVGNAFRILFMEQGMTFKPNTVDADKAQLVASRQFQLGDLARVTGLSPHLLFDLSRATFSNIEHLGIEAVTYSFKPWAKKLMQEANRKLLYESEKGRFECVLDLSPILAGDSKTQAEVDQIDIGNGALTPNERRAKRGLNPLPGGDELFINAASVPLRFAIAKAEAEATAAAPAAAPPTPTNDEPPPDATAGAAEPDGEPGPDVTDALVEDVRSAAVLAPVVTDVLARLARRDAKAVTSATEKHVEDDAALVRWIDTYAQQTRSHVAEVLSPLVATVSAMTGSAIDVEQLAAVHVAQTRTDLDRYMTAERSARADALSSMTREWQEERLAEFSKQIIGGH